MKKRKINIGNTLIAALILIFLIVCLVMLFKSLKKDFKVDMNTKTIQVGEEFTNEFKAYYKGIDVTDNVKIDTNLNNGLQNIDDVKKSFTEIFDEAGSISKISQEHSASIEEVLAITEEQNEQLHDIACSMKEIADLTKELRDLAIS